MKNIVKKQYGFTLLELVVVVAVMGLIASLATEFVVHESNQSRYDETKERRAVIRDALSNYYDDCGEFPDSLNWLVGKSNLSSDKCGPSNDDWVGPYILDVDFDNGVPIYRDGWGNASGAVATDTNFGWKYDNNTASVALATFGLDGSSGQVSDSTSAEFKFESDEGDGFTLLTAPSSGSYYLISVVSGAVSVLSCREGSASTAASQVSMSSCI